MSGLDNKISNIIGTFLPPWLKEQLKVRSEQNSQDTRDNTNLQYLANKSAWVRLISSIDIGVKDIENFKKLYPNTTWDTSALAKNFTLFGGTSKYIGTEKQELRYGVSHKTPSAYNLLGESEIKKYGYRPMPGITGVTVKSMGRLGSIRSATIEFKCWDKDQLDIMDALYFKLGFTMFLEWGHTFYYKTENEKLSLKNSAFASIDIFNTTTLTKEEIGEGITKARRDTAGNYDAMLGMVTNFTFTYNQEGGYDCTVTLMSLGILGESIPINNQGKLPDLLKKELKGFDNMLLKVKAAQDKAAATAVAAVSVTLAQQEEKELPKSIDRILNFEVNNSDAENLSLIEKENILKKAGIGSGFIHKDNIPFTELNVRSAYEQYDYLYSVDNSYYSALLLKRFNLYIPEKDTMGSVKSITLDTKKLEALVKKVFTDVYVDESDYLDNLIRLKFTESSGDTMSGQYIAPNGKTFNFKIIISSQLPSDTYTQAEYQPNAIKKLILTHIFNDKNLLFTTFTFDTSTSGTFSHPEKNGIDVSYELRLRATYKIPALKLIKADKVEYNQSIPKKAAKDKFESVDVNIPYTIIINDSSLIIDIIPTSKAETLDYINKQKANKEATDATAKIIAAKTAAKIEADKLVAKEKQIANALNLQSSLEMILRAIELHALTSAITTTNDLDIEKKVHEISLGADFRKDLFSKGAFSSILEDLIKDTKPEVGVGESLSNGERFYLYAKFGFVSGLMKSKLSELKEADFKLLHPVNYEELLKAYVFPYRVSHDVITNIEANHPVYITFGLLLMILNHTCTIYDTKNKTPLVYVDFNPKHNFCLSNEVQLTTNPLHIIIPCEASFESYRGLFDESMLRTVDGVVKFVENKNTVGETLFASNDSQHNALSGYLPPFRDGTTDYSSYRGNIMAILLSTDYLVNIVRDYSLRDGSNKIHLNEFIEQILSDINKALGDVNSFRLSYNDNANSFQIVDDQIIPTPAGEEMLEAKSTDTDLPLFGKKSIAKSLEIKTNISSKLANMIAISANSEMADKSVFATSGDAFGAINSGYVDRYIPTRANITAEETKKEREKQIQIQEAKTQGDIAAAEAFNYSVYKTYGTVNISESDVDQATNYYMDKMAGIKNSDVTRASTMIPVSVDFSTDGISGFTMGQAFTIPKELLPYTYANDRINVKANANTVGFVIAGLTHKISNNSWETSVSANMIFLKNKIDYTNKTKYTRMAGGVAKNLEESPGETTVSNVGLTKLSDTNYSNVKFDTDGTQNDNINTSLLNDLQKAAQNAGLTITITTGVSGHSNQNSRHVIGNAVDIAIINGAGSNSAISATTGNPAFRTNGNKLKDALVALGYVHNNEIDNSRAVFWQTNSGGNHFNHLHISNNT